jgi:catechol 2,3-dioxygenase-like lactoylglutathione lyase family enzyme
MRVLGVDHVVFKVADTRRSVAWYGDELGLEVLRFDEWDRGEVPFPSVRINANTIIDLVEAERSGENVDHVCLVVADDVDDIAESGRFEVMSGPEVRWGARGNGRSVYVLDPDGNTIELRNYSADID